MIPYSIDFEKLRKEIRKMGYRKVLLQLPEGMMIYAIDIIKELKDFEVGISANSCYGACDVEIHPDKLTVQFGHADIPNIKYPENILFVESFSDVSVEDVVHSFIETTPCRRVGLTTSVQYIHKLKKVEMILKEAGFQVYIGKGDGRVKYPGQVLGCNFSSARSIMKSVDCFVFVGTGKFHALGIGVTTGKPVYVLDPHSKTIESVDEEANKFLKIRFGAISMAEDAKKFGIIVGTKIGQRREKLAYALKRLIEERDREAYVFYANDISPEKFYYDVDIFVNTACPRITYDEYLRFPKPVISPIELEIALKFKDWRDFRFDEIVEVDGDKY